MQSSSSSAFSSTPSRAKLFSDGSEFSTSAQTEHDERDDREFSDSPQTVSVLESVLRGDVVSPDLAQQRSRQSSTVSSSSSSLSSLTLSSTLPVLVETGEKSHSGASSPSRLLETVRAVFVPAGDDDEVAKAKRRLSSLELLQVFCCEFFDDGILS